MFSKNKGFYHSLSLFLRNYDTIQEKNNILKEKHDKLNLLYSFYEHLTKNYFFLFPYLLSDNRNKYRKIFIELAEGFETEIKNYSDTSLQEKKKQVLTSIHSFQKKSSLHYQEIYQELESGCNLCDDVIICILEFL